MQKTLLAILGAFVLAVPMSAFAGDGDTPEKAKSEEKTEKVKEEKKVAKEDSESDDHKGGNVFTRFWTHTVGGSIGHGLKHGTHKVTKAFGSDD